MDIASLLGLIGALGFIIYAMVSGGGIGPFIDVPSLAIVFGGTFFCVMYTCPLPTFLGSFGVMAKAFFPPVKPQDELVTKMVELAGIARKDGMMALEGQETPDPFFDGGLQMLVDGADEQKLTVQLKKELKTLGFSSNKTLNLCSPQKHPAVLLIIFFSIYLNFFSYFFLIICSSTKYSSLIFEIIETDFPFD